MFRKIMLVFCLVAVSATALAANPFVPKPKKPAIKQKQTKEKDKKPAKPKPAEPAGTYLGTVNGYRVYRTDAGNYTFFKPKPQKPDNTEPETKGDKV